MAIEAFKSEFEVRFRSQLDKGRQGPKSGDDGHDA